MTLSQLVKEQAPYLNIIHISHHALADIFTIVYKHNLIGYYDPQHHNLTLDGKLVSELVEV